MIDIITEKEFKDCGALGYVNMILQPFGLALVMTEEGDLKPAKSKYIGFDEKGFIKIYKGLRKYMKDNGEILLQEVENANS